MAHDRRIFISVAEDSADLHAASLVRRAAIESPHWRFIGLAGQRMREAGVSSIADLASHAAMLTGLFSQIGRARRAMHAAEKSWRDEPPAVVVLMDSSALHLPMARRAKRLGLPVLYYIAPQTWASRPGRNRKLARDVDRVACILPFEEAHFRQVGVNADYVGHPLVEALAERREDPTVVAGLRAAGKPIIALLPGSREQVVRRMLPLQLAVVRQLGNRVACVISCASSRRLSLVRAILERCGVAAEVLLDQNESLLAAAELALVASGTATLEVAYARKPMIVVYDAGGALRWAHAMAGRHFLKTPHLALVNVLAGARVVPEFMPFARNPAAIAGVASQLLEDRVWRNLMIRQLDALVKPMERSQASAGVCRMLREMIGEAGAPGLDREPRSRQ